MPQPLRTLCLNLGLIPFKPEKRYRGQRGRDRQDRKVAFRRRIELGASQMRARALEERGSGRKTGWLEKIRLDALAEAERELYGEPGALEGEIYGC